MNKQSDAHQEYVRNWETDVRDVFENNLNAIIERKKSWQSHGEGFGIDGTVLGEMLHHSQWAAEKVKSFYGRDDLLQEAIDIIIKSDMRPIREGNDGRLDGIALCVVGPSGAGKTAFLAKLAQLLYDK